AGDPREEPLSLGLALAVERAPAQRDVARAEQSGQVGGLLVLVRVEAEQPARQARRGPRGGPDHDPEARELVDGARSAQDGESSSASARWTAQPVSGAPAGRNDRRVAARESSSAGPGVQLNR